MRQVLLVSSLLTLFALAFAPPRASAQINMPGRHPHYVVELEPHLVWQWNNDEAASDDGIGIGGRASIPILEDGPVRTINNNLAISFGIDWAHFPDCRYNGGCVEDDIWVPVVMQWNFFLTPRISIFPEFGLAFRDAIFGYDDPYCDRNDCRHSSLRVYPAFWFGGRIHLIDSVALVLRLGTPSLHFGVSFFL